jgi:hypothetical protein
LFFVDKQILVAPHLTVVKNTIEPPVI